MLGVIFGIMIIYSISCGRNFKFFKPFNGPGVCQWPMFNHLTCDLMAHNTRASKRKFTFYYVKVRVANPARCMDQTLNKRSQN